MASANLPAEFEDLQPFIDWALPTWTERSRKRLDTSMADIREFYDAMIPRLKDVVAYLNQFPLDGMPAGAKALFYMTLSLNKIALAVENFDQQRVPYGFGEERFGSVAELPD
jgi:hypothetical protein